MNSNFCSKRLQCIKTMKGNKVFFELQTSKSGMVKMMFPFIQNWIETFKERKWTKLCLVWNKPKRQTRVLLASTAEPLNLAAFQCRISTPLPKPLGYTASLNTFWWIFNYLTCMKNMPSISDTKRQFKPITKLIKLMSLKQISLLNP